MLSCWSRAGWFGEILLLGEPLLDMPIQPKRSKSASSELSVSESPSLHFRKSSLSSCLEVFVTHKPEKFVGIEIIKNLQT